MLKLINPQKFRIRQDMIIYSNYDMIKYLLGIHYPNYVLSSRLFYYSIENGNLSILQLFDMRLSRKTLDLAISNCEKCVNCANTSKYTLIALKKLKTFD